MGVITGLAPLAIDVYIPALPGLARDLVITDSVAQLTVTVFLISVVFGQLVFGPLSDGVGRRPVIIAAVVLFTVSSVACAAAPSIALLLVGRAVQGIAAGGGAALARAVIADKYSGSDLAKYFAILAQVLAVTPVLAPLVGAGVLAFGDWRATFLVVAVLAAFLTVACLVFVGESLPRDDRADARLRSSLRAMGHLLGAKRFLGYAVTLGAASAALFAYISGSSFVFERVHGTTPTVYSLIFASNAVAMLVASAAFSRLLRVVSIQTMLLTALAVAVGASVLGLAVTSIAGPRLPVTWITLLLVLGCLGIVLPASTSLGQIEGHGNPGATSALLGALQFAFGAVAAPIVGLFTSDSPIPLLGIVAASVAVAAIAASATTQWHVPDHTEE